MDVDYFNFNLIAKEVKGKTHKLTCKYVYLHIYIQASFIFQMEGKIYIFPPFYFKAK